MKRHFVSFNCKALLPGGTLNIIISLNGVIGLNERLAISYL
jgi:hypothetical protein